jgi:hypothetical protein
MNYQRCKNCEHLFPLTERCIDKGRDIKDIQDCYKMPSRAPLSPEQPVIVGKTSVKKFKADDK